MFSQSNNFVPIFYTLHSSTMTPYPYFVGTYEPLMRENIFMQGIQNFTSQPSRPINTFNNSLICPQQRYDLNYKLAQKSSKNNVENPDIKNNYIKEENPIQCKKQFQIEEQSLYTDKEKVLCDMKKRKPAPKNKNRNIIPSMTQQILAFISKQTKSKQVCQRIFSQINDQETSQFTISRYYSYIREVKQKQNYYTTASTLKILFVPEDIENILSSSCSNTFKLFSFTDFPSYYIAFQADSQTQKSLTLKNSSNTPRSNYIKQLLKGFNNLIIL